MNWKAKMSELDLSGVGRSVLIAMVEDLRASNRGLQMQISALKEENNKLEKICDDYEFSYKAAMARAKAAGLALPGWFCACGVFNGTAKEETVTCRACCLPR